MADRVQKLKPRTDQQNKSIHLFCEWLAKELNEAGLDQRKVLKPSISIPWTKIAIKEQIFKPIMKAMYQKSSTTELLKTGEIEEVHRVIMRELGEKHGVEYIPFPSALSVEAQEKGYIAGYAGPLEKEKSHV